MFPKYDCLIVDTVNLAYRVFNDPSSSVPERERRSPLTIGNKRVYPYLVASLIREIKNLEALYTKGEQTILLYDNYTSKQEYRDAFQPLTEGASRKKINPDYKKGRKTEKKEFYNSLDLVRYYFCIGDTKYHTVRIPRLEADDLLMPCLRAIGNKTALIVSNDSDWSKGLSDKVDIFIDHSMPIFSVSSFKEKYSFNPSEEHIVLHKLLYGDKVDNIKDVFPMMTSEDKVYCLQTFTSIHDMMYGVQFDERLKKYAIDVKNLENEIKVSFQMLSSIQVADAHFKNCYTTGRGSITLKKALDDVLFPHAEDTTGIPDFGEIKVPRA